MKSQKKRAGRREASFDDGDFDSPEQKNKVAQLVAMGFEAMQAQQAAFLKAMTGGVGTAWSGPSEDDSPKEGEDLDAIKKQLAELQNKLSKLK